MAPLGNLAARFLVALIAVPILVAAMYSESSLYTWILVAVGSVLAMNEFFAMGMTDRKERISSLLCGAGAVTAFYWLPREHAPLVALVIAVVPTSLFFLFCFGDLKTVATRMTTAIVGIVYGGLLLTFLAVIKRDFGASGGHCVLFVLLIAWISDTGGYFAGKFFGKTKLYPAVSPGKTWAGAVGGLAFAIIAMAIVKMTLAPTVLSWFDVLALAVPGSILGQLGDLVESMIKRSTGVKDSGALLPGHGGILDRIDAVLFIAPYVYFYFTAIRPGGLTPIL